MLVPSSVWGALRLSPLLVAPWLAIGLALWPAAAWAAIYTWTDAEGAIHYSDTPVQGAMQVHPGRGNTVANPHYNQALLRKQIPYRDIGGQMHVAGRVNGVPVDFIVDTGASLVVIPRTVAAQAGIGTEGEARLQTANGMMDAPVARIGRLAVGALHAQDVRAVVHDVDESGRTGLLGMNVLGAYRMTIDHDRHLLLLEPK